MPVTIALAVQLMGLVASGVALAPQMVSAAATIKDLLTSNSDPTPEQEASIRADLDASEAAVQNA